MTDPVEDFVAMSAVLTGIGAAQLARLPPQTRLPRLSALYYQKAQAEAGAALADLLQLYSTVAGGTSDPAVIGKALFDSPPATSFLARSIILEWYLGLWYDPGSLQAYASAPFTAQLTMSVISEEAYENGLAWRIAQAHPMGYSNLQYGYWNVPPNAGVAR